MILDTQLGRPVYALQTLLRRIAVSDPALPVIIPDGIFGSETTESVIAFRTKYGPHPPVGEVDYETWLRILEVHDEFAALEQIPSTAVLYPAGHIIRAGDESKHILPIQAMTAVLAETYPQLRGGTVSGIHDEDSVEAVKKLQKLFGLPVNGTVDPVFWEEFVRFYEANAFLDTARSAQIF